MSDVDKHFDTARRLARHAAEREWLQVAYETLERQKAVLYALNAALDSLTTNDRKEVDVVLGLRHTAARVVIAQCESIMRHSGMSPDTLGEIADPPGGDQAEAREETLPW